MSATRCCSSTTHPFRFVSSIRGKLARTATIATIFFLTAQLLTAQMHSVGSQPNALSSVASDSSSLDKTDIVANPPAPQHAQPQPSGPARNPAAPPLILPAGTKIALGLERPLSVKSAKAGDSVYLQVTFPVTVDGTMVVPPGAYLEGTIAKVVRRDRRRAVLEFEMQPARLIFANGYTAAFTGTAPVQSASAEPARDDHLASVETPVSVPIMQAFPTATPPPLPPLPRPSLGSHTGAIVGISLAAAGSAVVAVLLARRSDVEMAVGTPLQMILPQDVPLERDRVMAAVQQYSAQIASAPPQIVQPPPKICYDPGTPDTVIPGSPGMDPTVIPGANGAPDIIIPGTPATPDTVIPGAPGRQYPCPK